MKLDGDSFCATSIRLAYLFYVSDIYSLSGRPDFDKTITIINNIDGAYGMQKAAAVSHYYVFIHEFQNIFASGT